MSDQKESFNEENTPHRRRVLLINPKFQISFLAYTCGIAFAILGIFFTANRYFFWKFAQRGKQIGLPPEHVFFRFLTEQQTMMDVIFFVTATITFTALIVYGLYLSNRVAGPIYRLKKYLVDYASGRVTSKLTFRKKDYFLELAAHVNDCLDKVDSKNTTSRSEDKKVG